MVIEQGTFANGLRIIMRAKHAGAISSADAVALLRTLVGMR